MSTNSNNKRKKTVLSIVNSKAATFTNPSDKSTTEPDSGAVVPPISAKSLLSENGSINVRDSETIDSSQEEVLRKKEPEEIPTTLDAHDVDPAKETLLHDLERKINSASDQCYSECEAVAKIVKGRLYLHEEPGKFRTLEEYVEKHWKGQHTVGWARNLAGTYDILKELEKIRVKKWQRPEKLSVFYPLLPFSPKKAAEIYDIVYRRECANVTEPSMDDKTRKGHGLARVGLSKKKLTESPEFREAKKLQKGLKSSRKGRKSPIRITSINSQAYKLEANLTEYLSTMNTVNSNPLLEKLKAVLTEFIANLPDKGKSRSGKGGQKKT